MALCHRLPRFRQLLYSVIMRFSSSGGYDPGRGAGSGGGGGGSIRNAGGAFAKLQAVREEEYFIKQQHELLKKLKNRKITLDKYHADRMKIVEKYVAKREKRNKNT